MIPFAFENLLLMIGCFADSLTRRGRTKERPKNRPAAGGEPIQTISSGNAINVAAALQMVSNL